MGPRRMLRFAFAFSTLLYGVLLYATERNYTLQPLSAGMRRPIVIALYAIAVVVFFIALNVRTRSGEEIAAATPRAIDAAFVVRLALFESVAIFGLLAGFVLHDWRVYLPAWALSLLGFALTPAA